MNLDRFQPPRPDEGLYRCEKCGEIIDEAQNVFMDDVPYHLECVPEPPFEDDQPTKKDHSNPWAWLIYCTVCSVLLIGGLLIHTKSEQSKGVFVMSLMLAASFWFLVKVVRR